MIHESTHSCLTAPLEIVVWIFDHFDKNNEIETRNWEEIPFSLWIVPWGLQLQKHRLPSTLPHIYKLRLATRPTHLGIQRRFAATVPISIHPSIKRTSRCKINIPCAGEKGLRARVGLAWWWLLMYNWNVFTLEGLLRGQATCLVYLTLNTGTMLLIACD